MEKCLLSSFWLEPLEPRLLFSADLVPPPPEGGLAGGEAVAVVETPLRPAGSATDLSQASEQLRRELLFIDGEVKDYQQLLDDFIARQEGRRNILAVVLDPAADGIAQISAYLRAEGNIDAIHLVSHGSDGAVKLGNVWLSAQNLDAHAEAIEGWRLALSEEADLLLYGCNLAQGEAGRALLDNLRLITGADVASTDDITGHQSLGGDWDLEYRLGAIETGIAFSTGLQKNWNGILATTYLANETATDSSEVKIDQNWGQSFSYTSGNGTYVVDQLSLQLRKEVGAVGQTLTVSLRASWNGPVLGSNTLDATELTSSFAWKAFTFGEVSLNDGQTYYIRISSSSNAGKVHVGVNSSGGYAGGDLINKDGVADSGKDLAFRVADVSQDGLWITTANGLNAGGNIWGKADLVQLFDPNLSFSPGVTGGTFNTGASLSTAADGKQVNGVHYVTTAIQVGVNAFQLLPGDLLFLSIDATAAAFGGLNVDKDDVVLYRPDSPGNYSTGTYSILIRNMVPGQELRGITLVEKNTVVGSVTLQAGDFLFLRQGGSEEKQVWRYTDYTAGNVDGGGTASVLIDGGEDDININKRLVGIDLVETTITLGGRTLNAGTVLLAVDSATTVGKNNLAVTEFDIFALEVDSADIDSATASLFFKGADLGLSNKIDGFSLNVGVNAAPVLTPPAANLTPISEDNVANSGSLVSTILAGSASDANGDPLGLALTATVAGNGSWQYSTNGGSSWTPVGAVADNNALLLRGPDRIRFVPDGKNADTASISYRAWDQSSGSAGQKATTTPNGGSSAYSLATDTATINVTAVNDAPTDITLDNLTVPENAHGAVIGNLATSDVDTGDSHGYTVNDARFEVVGSQLKLKASTALDFEAEPTVSLTVTSTDSAGLSIQKALVITVTNVNENPVAGTDSLSTVENVPLLITTADLLLNDADEDLDPLSIVGFTQPANGAVVDNLNGTWTYTPGSSFYGVDSLTYTLSDGNGGTAIGTIHINVSEAANTAPVALVDNLLTVEDSPLTITVASDIRGNDYDNDGDPLTVTGFTQPANGTLVDNLDGSWTYTPDLNFNGSDSFSYTISDGKGGTATGTAIILVTAVGDTPQVTNGSAISGRQSELIFVTRNAADGAEVTHFRISGISGGTLSLADGVTQVNNGDFISVAQGQAGLKFSPNSGSVAPGSFQAEASEDGLTVAAQSSAATATITVTRPSQQPDKPAEENKKEQAETKAEDDVPIVVPGFSESLTRAAEITAPPADSVFLPQDAPRRASLTLSLPVLIQGREMATADLTSEVFNELKNLFEAAPDLLKGFENSLASLDISSLTPEAYTRVRDMLDAIQNDLGQQIRLEKTLIGSAIATSVGLSAGYVVWMLQGGSLLASVLSSIPAWQLADPLSILAGSRGKDEEEDEDSLEKIIADGSEDEADEDESESKD